MALIDKEEFIGKMLNEMMEDDTREAMIIVEAIKAHDRETKNSKIHTKFKAQMGKEKCEEIVTHNKNKTKIVKKLTAVAAPATLKKTFKTENMPTKIPGRAVAVAMVFIFQFVAPVNL